MTKKVAFVTGASRGIGLATTRKFTSNGVIYFLASDEARHITGACIDVNAGYVLR